MNKLFKLFNYLIILFLLASPVYGTNYYFDLASGNDTTGDGSAGNPWKTIDKCTTSRTGGDECRGAKTTITTLSGTLTFTNGSTSVATSVDQTGTVAAGDLIGKNSGLEGWWKVASLNSTTITLTYQYWGLSGSGSAVTGYKITPVTASEEYDVASSGTSSASRLKISGGWDLTGPTQDGITAFSSSYSNPIDTNSKNYLEISKFIISATSLYGLGLNGGTDIYAHDMWVEGSTTIAINQSSSNSDIVLENVVQMGGTGDGGTFDGINPQLLNVYFFSPGTGTGDDGIVTKTPVIFDNVRIYNSYAIGFNLDVGSSLSLFKNCIVDTTRTNSCIATSSGVGDIRFFNLTLSNATAYAVNIGSTYGFNLFFIESSLSAGGSGLFSIATTFPSQGSIITYKPAGADSVQYFTYGTIEHDSSGDCRSGKCLKFTAGSDKMGVQNKVGSVKIPSAASDLTLSSYLKDDGSYNGRVFFIVLRNGKVISKTEKTPTTSYVKEDVVVDTGDLVEDEYLDLYVYVTGTAGNVWIDDFSASQ